MSEMTEQRPLCDAAGWCAGLESILNHQCMPDRPLAVHVPVAAQLGYPGYPSKQLVLWITDGRYLPLRYCPCCGGNPQAQYPVISAEQGVKAALEQLREAHPQRGWSSADNVHITSPGDWRLPGDPGANIHHTEGGQWWCGLWRGLSCVAEATSQTAMGAYSAARAHLHGEVAP